MKKYWILMSVLLLLFSCTNNRNKKVYQELSGQSYGSDDTLNIDGDFIVDSEISKLDSSNSFGDLASDSQQNLSNQSRDNWSSINDLNADQFGLGQDLKNDNSIHSSKDSFHRPGEISYYTIEKGDTLMFIAFKLTGDYNQWRQLRKLNPSLSKKGLVAGEKIKYQVPEVEFRWQPEGLPYRIKSGDTLSIIAKKLYGTDRRWRDLYNNNQPMIQDPHLIFAGFTLYYKDDYQRKLAQESL
jgi:LysM repeat protein